MLAAGVIEHTVKADFRLVCSMMLAALFVAALPTPSAAQVIQDTTAFVHISKKDLRTIRYGSLSEVLKRGTLFQPLSLGGFGQPNSVSMFGGNANDIGVSFNGRTMMDVWSGSYNLEQHSPEGYDAIDIYVGADAIGLAPQPTLTWVNLQGVRHNTARPYSVLWYSQGGGDLIAGDVTLSQNVAENLNVTVGVRRNGARGVFQRTDFDVWNARLALTYTPSPLTTVDVRYDISSMNTDLWGGLLSNVTLTNVNEATAETVQSGLRDETRRHDGTVTLIQRLAPDSSSTLTTVAYYTSNDLLRLRDSTTLTTVDPVGTTPFVVRTSMLGAVGRLDQRLGSLRLRVGASIDLVESPAFDYADSSSDVITNFFGHATLPLSEPLTLRVAGRIGTTWGRPLTGLGAALAWRVEGGTLSADASLTQQASTLSEGRDLPFERHMLGMLSYKLDKFSVTAFHRRIENAYIYAGLTDSSGTRMLDARIVATNGMRSLSGMFGQITIPIGDFQVIPTGRIQYDPSNDTYAGTGVRAMGQLDISYRHVAGPNSLRLGAVGIIQTPFKGESYIPTRWASVHDPTEHGWSGNGLDLYLVGVLGNATLRVSYENILNQRWYTVPIYPEITQNIRVMLHWTFLE